nr:uncharacterized protein LOC127339209 [Lolium perenne]
MAQEEMEGEGCTGSANRCGNLTISAPFWLADLESGRSCGFLDFEITCFHNTPVLPSSKPFSYGFEIMNISYEAESMRVVDLGKLRLLPPASSSCNMPIWNTPEKLHRQFRIDPVSLNMIIYNCTNASPAARHNGELVETRMRCVNESHVFVSLERGHDEMKGVDGCDAVGLPVLGDANGEANASDYDRLIRNGFTLRWDRVTPPPPTLARKVQKPVTCPSKGWPRKSWMTITAGPFSHRAHIKDGSFFNQGIILSYHLLHFRTAHEHRSIPVYLLL